MSAYTSPQNNWYIDEANVTTLASNRNHGHDAAHPLRTDSERVRRMGRNFDWSASRYDIWCLSDVAVMELYGVRRNGTQIWVHGSGTAYQGAAILSGSNTMTQRAVAVPSTNVRPSLRGGNAGSFLTTLANPNRRLRLTSGARSWATAFAQSVSGSDVNVSQWTQLSTLDLSTQHVADICDPAGTETYVIEALGTIGTCYVDLKSADAASTLPKGIVFDSVNFGKFGSSPSTPYIWLLGCTGVAPHSPSYELVIKSFAIGMGCSTYGDVSYSQGLGFLSCHNVGAWSPAASCQVSFSYNTITEGTPMAIASGFGSDEVVVYGAAAFNSSSDGVIVGNGGILNIQPATSGPGPTVVAEPSLWGSGNTGYGARVQRGGRIMSFGAAQLPTITGSSGQRIIGEKPGNWADRSDRDVGMDAAVLLA